MKASAKRGFARKKQQEDGSWLLTAGLTGYEDVTEVFNGSAEEADNALIRLFEANFKDK